MVGNNSHETLFESLTRTSGSRVDSIHVSFVTTTAVQAKGCFMDRRLRKMQHGSTLPKLNFSINSLWPHGGRGGCTCLGVTHTVAGFNY